MTQPELFTTHRAPHRTSYAPATETRDASYAAIRSELSDRQRRYLCALERAAMEGIRTKSGEIIRDLTDQEATAILGWGVNQTTARRNELCGGSGSDAHVRRSPLVQKSQKRACHVTGRTVQAWRPTLQTKLL